MLCLLSKLSPVEYTEDGERATTRRLVDPVMRVIEKPCDLILKHMAVCFVSPFFQSLSCGRGSRVKASRANESFLLLGRFLFCGGDDQTPSFILIPSGTKIAGKEVGLLIVSLAPLPVALAPSWTLAARFTFADLTRCLLSYRPGSSLHSL